MWPAMAWVSSGRSAGIRTARRSPLTRTAGAVPALKWMSDAPALTAAPRNWLKLASSIRPTPSGDSIAERLLLGQVHVRAPNAIRQRAAERAVHLEGQREVRGQQLLEGCARH